MADTLIAGFMIPLPSARAPSPREQAREGLRVREGSVTARLPAFLIPRAGPHGALILPAVMVQSFLKASLTFSPACLSLLTL
jgi:hypothetical protein